MARYNATPPFFVPARRRFLPVAAGHLLDLRADALGGRGDDIAADAAGETDGPARLASSRDALA